MRTGGPILARLSLVALLISVAVACRPTVSSDATCPDEPRAFATLPDLEALLPPGLTNVTIDSGWNCRPESLRTYARHGVIRLEFAGATADEDGHSQVIAVYRSGIGGPTLQAAWVEEFYEGSARESGRVDNIETRRESISTAGEVWRMDGLNGLSLQSVVVWQDGPVVRVVIVASDVGPDTDRADHDALVTAVVSLTGVAPDPPVGRSAEPSVLPSAA